MAEPSGEATPTLRWMIWEQPNGCWTANAVGPEPRDRITRRSQESLFRALLHTTYN